MLPYHLLLFGSVYRVFLSDGGGTRLLLVWFEEAELGHDCRFKLVYEGSFHESLEIPAYGGELFESGEEELRLSELYVFENSCFDNRYSLVRLGGFVHAGKLMRTKVRIRQGRGSTYVSMPVDFSQLPRSTVRIIRGLT